MNSRTEPPVSSAKDKGDIRYRMLAEHVSVGIFELRLDGALTEINAKACRSLGVVKASASLGKPLAEQVHVACRETLAAAIKQAAGGENTAIEFSIEGKGEIVSLQVKLLPIDDETGKPRSLFGICSEKDTAQTIESLQESEQRYREMFEFSLAVKFLIDPATGRILESNGAASELYGYSQEEFQALLFSDLDSGASDGSGTGFTESVDQTARSSDRTHKTKSGQLVDVEVSSGPVTWTTGTRLYVVIRDITESKRQDQERDDSRERLELAVSGSAEGIWDIDLIRHSLYWSDSFKALLGFKPDELDPNEMEPYGNVHPADRDRMKLACQRHLEARTPYDEEARVLHADGQYRWMHTRGQAVWDEEGRALRMSGTLQDIHEKRLGEELMRTSMDRFAFAIAGSQDGIWDWEIATGRSWWSPKVFQLLGYEEGEFTPSRDLTYQMMHPDDRVATRESADLHIAKGKPFKAKYRMQLKTGEYRWFRSRGIAQLDDDNKPIRIYGCLSDIDEEVRKELARETRVKRVVEQQACILNLATDPDLAAGGLRDACMRITEYGAEVLGVGRCSVSLLEPGGTELLSINMFRQATDSHHDGFRLDLTMLPNFFECLRNSRVLVSSNPLQDPRFDEFPREHLEERMIKSIIQAPVRRGGELVGVVAISETRFEREWEDDEIDFALNLAQQVSRLLEAAEVQSAEERQRELERQVLQAQKMESLGLMAGGVAHDFNNLLVVILGNADLLKGTLAEGSRGEGLLNEICSASQRAAELCQQMLAFSGRGHLSASLFDLPGVVQEMSHLLRISIAKNAELVQVPSSPCPNMKGDATQVRQVIMNLILNASEALPDHGGRITLRTGVRYISPSPQVYGIAVPRGADYLFLEVSDTGQGMGPDTLNRIFDPFFSTKFTGRGLGMAAVLGIMRAHGGGIQVESTPGQGSCFEIRFPVATDDSNDPDEPSSPIKTPWTGTGVVLLVDDDRTVCELGARMLERIGYKVLVAGDGEQALELFRKHQQELVFVLLDLTMPEMSGHEVSGHFQSIDSAVPIILSTGYTAHDASQRLAAIETSSFLQKPYTLAELRGCIQELLA